MKIHFISISTIFSIFSCFSGSQNYEIKDVTRPEVVILEKEYKQENVHAIAISGKGHISGKATLILILNEKPYKTLNLSGKINFQWNGDWYSDTAEIVYRPLSVDVGQLQITYRFEDI
jgi:hypothetical protein